MFPSTNARPTTNPSSNAPTRTTSQGRSETAQSVDGVVTPTLKRAPLLADILPHHDYTDHERMRTGLPSLAISHGDHGRTSARATVRTAIVLLTHGPPVMAILRNDDAPHVWWQVRLNAGAGACWPRTLFFFTQIVVSTINSSNILHIKSIWLYSFQSNML